jgi:hypothetical protein
MLVFRSFAIGLSAACFALLVIRPTVELRVADAPPISTIGPQPYADHGRATTPALPTIVDAAPGITPAQLALTIRLAPGEAITSVDDVAVSSNLGAGIVLASRELRAGHFIDLGVDGPAGPRRVLVLLHEP